MIEFYKEVLAINMWRRKYDSCCHYSDLCTIVIAAIMIIMVFTVMVVKSK